MVDIYDSETLVKIYKLLFKRCEALDKFINNYGLYFCPCSVEFGARDLYENIENLMERKNKLINLKIILDNAIKSLDDKDRKMVLVKMKYNVSIDELCGIFDLKKRTVFRRIEHAYSNLTDAINSTSYHEKVKSIMESEDWIRNIRQEVESRRVAYGEKEINNL